MYLYFYVNLACLCFKPSSVNNVFISAEMATQVDDSTNKPDPIVVGNAFAEQYYNTLSMSPELLHNFYNDSSLIGRPGLDGSVSSTSTLEVSHVTKFL